MSECPSSSTAPVDGEASVDLSIHPSGIVPQLQVKTAV